MIAAHLTSCMKKVSHTHNETLMLAEKLMLTTNSLFSLCDVTVEVIANKYHTGLQFNVIKQYLGAGMNIEYICSCIR